MKNYSQFTPLTEKEAAQINGGGVLDGLLGTLQGVIGNLPIVGPLASTLLNLIKGLLGSTLPV